MPTSSISATSTPRIRCAHCRRFGGWLVVAAGLLAGFFGGCAMVSAPGKTAAQPIKMMTAILAGEAEMEMVWIEPGTFTMGSVILEEPAPLQLVPGVVLPMDFTDEQPAHQVTISKGFWMGKYEVTQGQWQAVMGNNPSRFQGTKRPVEMASWYDVQQFIAKLNQTAGRALYRLPTEAEWEYACRAGTTTRWSFGADESRLGRYAWWGKNSRGSTREVGRKRPNPWGLYDMHGNVSEWVQDWKRDYSSEAKIDPAGPAVGSFRVYRGGSYVLSSASDFRVARRAGGIPVRRDGALGFRLVRTAD